MTPNLTSIADAVNVPLRAVVGNPELLVRVIPESVPPGALDRPVRWAHVSELRDPTPYLLGYELLLTAGVNLPPDQAQIDRYVRRLRDCGVTALGFGLTPSMFETLPELLLRACVRHGLPLVVVEPRTPFLAISRAVSVALSEAGQREQRRIAAAREALTRAASDGLGELVGALGTRLHCWVALVGGGDVLEADHGAPAPLPPEVGELLRALRTGTGIRSATTELADGTFVVAQPVYPQATASHLLVVGRGSRYDSGDRAILAVAAALLGLAGHAGTDVAELGAAATGLLLGSTGPDRVTESLVGTGQCRLIAGIAHRRGPTEVAARYDWLRARLDTPLVQLLPGPRFVAITPSLPELDPLREYGWLAVASNPVPASRLKDTAAEVELLLDRARALGRAVVASEMGLDAVVSPGAAAQFAARTLAPLSELDREQDRDLVVTLRSWLAHHGGWDRTAAELGVHRNSVRHRIAQVERALGVDLADPEVRMQLWFALKWVPEAP